VDDATVEIYERRATEWIERRGEATDGLGLRFRELAGDGPVADLGCGAGRYVAEIGPPLVAMDASSSMLELARRSGCPLVRGDLETLPFANESLVGGFARNAYLHLPKDCLGLALAELHRTLRPGGLLFMTMLEGGYEGRDLPGDDFAGRYFSCWEPGELEALIITVGFTEASVEPFGRRDTRERGLLATARR
jgi:SAM-dependent methyltransferase